jgi:hypothetical protein
MTDRLVDISRFQVGLDLAAAKAAGYSKVNIALTGSRGVVSDPGWVRGWADRARRLGMGIYCYHWLTGASSGAAQARSVLRMMTAIGDLDDVAHQVDCEDTQNPATWPTWRDYVSAMQDARGRHVLAYTGDWWKPRGWNGASLTPYLMAAPNAGRLPAYPGDTSGHWIADYGGWWDLSAMQWGIGPIGGVDCSLAAIRDPSAWAALIGTETPAMDIVTRAEWGARPPSGPIAMTTWRARTGFVVHYSAANKDQTVRSIQNYQMDHNGWSDIGYNFLVDYHGRIYEGRQGTWLAVGAHVEGHNTENIGVCAIGTDADITTVQMAGVRWLYDEACRRKGSALAKRYHSQYANDPRPGANVTSCPGDRLRNWVRAGMPVTPPAPPPAPDEEDDMGNTYVYGEIPALPDGKINQMVPPIEAGGIPWGRAFLTVGGELYGMHGKFRAVGWTEGGPYALASPANPAEPHLYQIGSGQFLNFRLLQGTRMVSFIRVPVDASDTCTVPIGYGIEIAPAPKAG